MEPKSHHSLKKGNWTIDVSFVVKFSIAFTFPNRNVKIKIIMNLKLSSVIINRCLILIFWFSHISGWCHVVCALFIPEAWFANVQTMEPIVLKNLPQERFNKVEHFMIDDI